MQTDDLANYTDLLPLSDPTIALDFLLATKNGIRNYAIAITESSTPEVRQTLRMQMNLSIDLHEQLSNLMIAKGWLHPYQLNEQFALDLQSVQAALKVASLELFPPAPPVNTSKEANEL